ncbi:pantothenate synthetase [endosymbiont of Riftia pachyptila (vent Ph05)]|uniref:Pantothenate synthetase n=3 Tax=Gammaproteobacteria TaxID=1236 RepID=G2FCI2_9GAMM|nr:pantothenate synthetase [endosymbiont of Riftia pachyptila (vent Ph05)]EGW55545.1 pantoate--alpha-alanine ligase [endosymbiont of Tevnia jerichonana (vent Tica)]
MAMQQTASIEALRQRVREWRAGGERVAFVPTMGNLHAGHMALVEAAQKRAERCVVSIFVNPLQFAAGEDLESYPRTLAADWEKLAAAGVDLLFLPSVETIYPAGQAAQTRVEVPLISDMLCGASRPGHFAGVATVVCKLFNMVQPDLALFGEKDFQQLMVIRRMVADLAMPLQIVGVPTSREPDGLARSSRNGYLTEDERKRAPALYAALQMVAEGLKSAQPNPAELLSKAKKSLESSGFRPDYVEILSADDLQPAARGTSELVVLAAAYLGRARLIDNLRVSLPPSGD